MRERPGLLLFIVSATAAASVVALATLPARASARPVVGPAVEQVVGTAVGTASGSSIHVCTSSPKPHVMTCDALIRTDVAAVRANAVAPHATPRGYGPADLRSAYALPAGTGGGPTVAVVDAYNNPHAAADLSVYRNQFGLVACTVANGCFTQVNQDGATSPLPANNTGWAGEESLDVDMVSAICPNCHILLVEASSASDASLYKAEDQAIALGAKYVSNSWGGDEYSGQTNDDTHFNHTGIVITASTGDDGAGTEYPATSRYVTAVGGTSLQSSSNARGWSETAWSGAGSGCSPFDPKPAWQSVMTSCSRRADADVSAVADPNTGVAVYQSFGQSGWVVYGGTSVAAPIIASIYALAGTPAAGTYPASYPYANVGSLFDVTSGSNGFCGTVICVAGSGWDGPTGLGTPNGTAAFTSSPAGPPTSPPPASPPPASPPPVTPPPVTPPPTSPSCVAAQLLGNPGFENGSDAPWVATPGVVNELAAEPARSGSWKAWLDGYGESHTDSLAQTVTVPTGCATSLSFYLHIDTTEQTTSTSYDSLAVSENGTVVATYSNLDHNTGYELVTIPISDPASSIAIAFVGTEDASLATSFVIDDAAVTTN